MGQRLFPIDFLYVSLLFWGAGELSGMLVAKSCHWPRGERTQPDTAWLPSTDAATIACPAKHQDVLSRAQAEVAPDMWLWCGLKGPHNPYILGSCTSWDF